MSDQPFDAAYAKGQLARKSSTLRRLIKSRYIANLVSKVRGRTVDVGCGAGQALERLPAGSAGVEVNEVLVKHLSTVGLDVRRASPNPCRIDLTSVGRGEFKTLLLSHVLEHFESADLVLSQLAADAALKGIERMVIVVPGSVGYRSDQTHKTFVDMAYLKAKDLLRLNNFQLIQSSYFPGNAKWLGRFFVYHELIVVYERSNAARG